MKKFFIESRIFGKSLSLTLILLLAVNCQTDESADIGIKENLPTEGIDAQSQARAREIVNSDEYREFTNQNESFFDKIQDENFFTLELFDFDNQTYNYDLINKRLSGTSFKSAEEFVREYEKMISLGVELGKKHPDLADPLMQEAMMNVDIEEPISQNEQGVRNQWTNYCKQDCYRTNRTCRADADGAYAAAILGCVCTGAGFCPCAVAISFAYGVALRYCDNKRDDCLWRCDYL